MGEINNAPDLIFPHGRHDVTKTIHAQNLGKHYPFLCELDVIGFFFQFRKTERDAVSIAAPCVHAVGHGLIAAVVASLSN